MADSRFIIFCQERTGSTLLVDLLSQHPDIECDGERLARPHRTSGVGESLRRLAARSIGTHWRMARYAARSASRVYGFKLLVYQVPRPGLWSLRTFHQRGWRVINLRRQHVVHQALSNLLAMRTRHYHRTAGQAAEHPLPVITPARLLRSLEMRLRRNALEDGDLQGIPHLRLTYETHLDQPAQWPACLDAAVAYLDLPPFPDLPAPRTARTYEAPLEQLLPNYADLMDAVARSPYRHLLAEG